MSNNFPKIEDVLKNNLTSLKNCKTKEHQIKLLEKILNKNYRVFLPKYYITKLFNIKPYRYNPLVDSGEFPSLKIGSRISIKTSCFAPLILSQYKNILEVNNANN